MSDLRKAAQQALEALEAGPDVDPIFAGETEAALRAALAQQPEPAQEPVAWMVEGSLYASKEVAQKMGGNAYTLQALYTAPPQRPLLTDGEIAHEVYRKWGMLPGANSVIAEFARAVERKVRGEA